MKIYCLTTQDVLTILTTSQFARVDRLQSYAWWVNGLAVDHQLQGKHKASSQHG
jgi:hypothetical protein